MSETIKKIIMPLILLVSLYAIIVFLVLLPAIGSISESKIVLSKRTAELQTIENKINVLKQTGSDKEKTDTILATVSELWPDNKDVSTFIISLENMAKNQGLTFNNVSISEPAKTSSTEGSDTKSATLNKNSVQFAFDTSGNYDQIDQIVKSLENFERFDSITSVTLSATTGSNLNAKFTGLIYYGK